MFRNLLTFFNIVVTILEPQILSLHSFQTLLFIWDQLVETLVVIDSESCQTRSFTSFLHAAIWSGSPNHIKFIKLRSRNRHTFFNIVVTHLLSQEDIQKIQDSPPVLGDIWLQWFNNATRFWLHSCKTKDAFRLFRPDPRWHKQYAFYLSAEW